MPSSGLGAYQVKIHQIVFGGLFFLVVLMGVRAMMAGGAGDLQLLGVSSVLVGAVLALDKYYWVLCPFLYSSGFRLPGFPFDSAELGCILLISVYFIRQAMHKEHPIRLTGPIMAALPIFVWICFIWFLNPTGIAMLGSSTLGARFYLKIVIGFVTLLVMSSLRFSERDCRILLYIVLVSTIVSLLRSIFLGRLAEWAVGAGADESMVRYEFLGALPIFTLLFSRYRLSQISTSLWKLAAAIGLAAVTVYTGKRRAFGTLLLIPFLLCFFTRRDKMLTAVWSILGAFLLAIVVAGHGSFYELPYSAQRTLGVLVPSFADKTAGGTSDLFREEVRRYGKEVIRSSPWVGRKGFSMDRDETSWMISQQGMGQASMAGHAYAGNWHNTWYAYACDFGLPAMFLWAGFMLYSVFWDYRGFRTVLFGGYARTVYLYYSFSLLLELIFSYTSGHSALTAMGCWLLVGTLTAIRNGAQDRQRLLVTEAS